MYQASLLLDFRGNGADAELQLPAERVHGALATQGIERLNEEERVRVAEYIQRNFSASLSDGRAFEIDLLDLPQISVVEGSPYVVAHLRLLPPPGARADLFELHCGVLLDRIPSQVMLVSVRTDWRTSTFANDPQLLAVLRANDDTVRVDRRNGAWWSGLGSVFRLGMRHIAEGTDHLLFLLALLLPAPLLVRNGRWASHSDVRRCLIKIAGIVTAFTLGHSATLAAGALDLVHVPSRPIEVLIAFSILVSAIHALRPMFPGREAVIAGFFGLVHGLAFATTLAGLGLGSWERAASILGFNLGIEAMQLIVVAAMLPSLILLSRTRLYGAIRNGGAVFAGTAAAGWIVQRLWNLPNPADAVVTALAQRALWIAFGLTLLGIVAQSSAALRVRNSACTAQAELP
jgi:hypothetical protein